jgi:hypothetical protein
MADDVDSDVQTVSVAAMGLVPTAGVDNIMYIIPLDAEQLIPSHVRFRLDFVNVGAGCLTTVVAICSGPRYAGAARPTVLST